ncbi:MAG: gas vesicle protein GvpG [Leptolyngbyaceae cyanobacterium]
MLLRLLMAPVTAPLSGVTWIAEKILDQVEDPTDELEALQKQLLTLQLAFDMGDVPEEAFEDQEEALLLQIQALQDQRAAEEAAAEQEEQGED